MTDAWESTERERAGREGRSAGRGDSGPARDELTERGRDGGGTGDVRDVITGTETYVHGRSGALTTQGTRSTPSGRRGKRGGGGERRMVPPAEPRSYYDQPVIKPPVWTWEVPSYLFFGGMGGAASALAAAADLAGRKELARHASIVSLTGITISPILLIADLGRPLRFLNMLRVFKLTSPMSVGSWILIANGASATPAAFAAITGLPIPGARLARLAAGVLGIPLATYTAVLLTNTAVPIWSEARWTLPFVFAAGGAASAGGAVMAICPAESAGPARRLAIGGAVIESVAVELMQRRLGELAEPYHEGTTQNWSIAAKTLTMLGGLGVAAFGRRSRRATMTSAAMLIGGAFCERWAVYKAGFNSARDPRYTVGPQRARREQD